MKAQLLRGVQMFNIEEQADVLIEVLQLPYGCSGTLRSALFDAHESGRLSVKPPDVVGKVTDGELGAMATAKGYGPLDIGTDMLIAIANELIAYRARVIPSPPVQAIDWDAI